MVREAHAEGGLIWSDALFWNAYYRWAIRSPLQREMTKMSAAIFEFNLVMQDNFTPAIRRAKWAFDDFGFALSLADKPRWLHPMLRAAYRISILRRLFA